MRYAVVHRPTRQLDLLAPPRQLPDWQALPAPLREQTTALLAHLLREHLRRSPRAEYRGEAGDE